MPSFFQNLFKKDADESNPESPVNSDRLTEPTNLLTAMNLASPFAAAAGEQFTVRELTMLLPAQFVRAESLPGDQPVALPLDLLRTSLQQGRPALRLSQIYLACPFLFSRQVQPGEDMEIVLPFQKVKRMLDGAQVPAASPFTAVAPPRTMESPFATSPFQQAAPVNSAGSPFAVRSETSAQAQNEVLSPFPTDALVPLEPAVPQNPFQRMEPAPPRPGTSPFQLVTPAAEYAPPPAPTSSVPILPMGTPPSPFAHAGNGDGNNRVRTGPVAAAEASGNFNAFDSNAAPPASFAQPAVVPGMHPLRPEPAVPPAVPAVPPAVASPGGTVIKVLLSTLLRDITADDLGFDPTAVPDHVETILSLDTVTPQLATGRVEISVEELRQGVEDRFRPAFARVRPGLRFVVPLSEIFRSLPVEAIPSPQAGQHIPISTSPFQTPFTLRADDDANDGKPPLPQFVAPAPPAPANPVAHFPVVPLVSSEPRPGTAPVLLSSAPPAAAMEPPVPEPPVPPPSLPFQIPAAPEPPVPSGFPVKLPGMPALPKLSGPPARPSPFSRPPGMSPPGALSELAPPVNAAPPAVAPVTLPKLTSVGNDDDLGQPFSAASLQSEPPAAAPASAPFDPSKLFGVPSAAKPPAAAVAPLRPAAVPAPGAAAPIEFNFGETPDMARVTLRAIFGTDQDLTPHEIVDRVAQLPGLRSAVAIIKGGVMTSGHESSSEDVAQFSASASRSCEYLAGLAESMGYGSSGTFTLRAGAGIRTFIIEGGNCLAVLHDQAGFAPGVRDKLLLTARILGDIAD